MILLELQIVIIMFTWNYFLKLYLVHIDQVNLLNIKFIKSKHYLKVFTNHNKLIKPPEE